MPTKKPTKTQLVKKADRLFSLYIRGRDGGCIRCFDMARGHLQCAHIHTRSYRATRWDPDNAVCLCAGCHKYFTHHPLEWRDYIEERFPGRWDEMAVKAKSHVSPDIEDVLEWLTKEVA